MQLFDNLKSNLLKAIFLSAIVGYIPNSSEKISQKGSNLEKADIRLESYLETNNPEKRMWENVQEYDNFIRSVVNENYIKNVGEVYDFYNINRELPKYGFKIKKDAITYFDCAGAVYKENSDSIYFYLGVSEEFFQKYLEYCQKNKENPREELESEIQQYIKHEAAHAFYCKLGKDLGEEYLFNVDYENTSFLYNVQHNLIEEGVAEYMAYYGRLPRTARRLNDEDLRKMIENKNDFYLYDLGFMLVKPILDINFHKGIEELIRNPLTREDLYDLPRYREKRIQNILK